MAELMAREELMGKLVGIAARGWDSATKEEDIVEVLAEVDRLTEEVQLAQQDLEEHFNLLESYREEARVANWKVAELEQENKRLRNTVQSLQISNNMREERACKAEEALEQIRQWMGRNCTDGLRITEIKGILADLDSQQEKPCPTECTQCGRHIEHIICMSGDGTLPVMDEQTTAEERLREILKPYKCYPMRAYSIDLREQEQFIADILKEFQLEGDS